MLERVSTVRHQDQCIFSEPWSEATHQLHQAALTLRVKTSREVQERVSAASRGSHCGRSEYWSGLAQRDDKAAPTSLFGGVLFVL